MKIFFFLILISDWLLAKEKGRPNPLEAPPPPSYGPDLIENNLTVLLCGQRRDVYAVMWVLSGAPCMGLIALVRVKLDLSFRVRSLSRKCGVGREFYPVKQLSTDSTLV